MRTSSFWFLVLSITARSLVSGGIGVHMVPYFVGPGASPVGAAALAGSVGVMSTVGRFGLSAMGGFVDRRYVMAVLMVFPAAQGGISVMPSNLEQFTTRRAHP